MNIKDWWTESLKFVLRIFMLFEQGAGNTLVQTNYLYIILNFFLKKNSKQSIKAIRALSKYVHNLQSTSHSLTESSRKEKLSSKDDYNLIVTVCLSNHFFSVTIIFENNKNILICKHIHKLFISQ